MIKTDSGWTQDFHKPIVIAGPCSAESEKQLLDTAAGLQGQKIDFFRAGIWKPRTKPNSFEGVGKKGLPWLKSVKEQFGFRTATEVANANHVQLALENNVDLLWIGARTTVNPFQVQEISEALKGTEKIVMVKNPVNPDLELWIGAFERLSGEGLKNVGAIHRGFSVYKKTRYRNEPQWQIPLDFKKEFPQIPLICDPSHITGDRSLIAGIAQEAINFGFDGLMIETHCNPDEAWSDAAQQITPERLSQILVQLILRDPDDPDAGYHLQLDALRAQIDEIDRNALDLISDRMQVAEKIGELKLSHNVTLFQPDRWAFVKKNMLDSAANYGLTKEFVERFLNAVHQESIQIQNRVMESKKTE